MRISFLYKRQIFFVVVVFLVVLPGRKSGKLQKKQQLIKRTLCVCQFCGNSRLSLLQHFYAEQPVDQRARGLPSAGFQKRKKEEGDFLRKLDLLFFVQVGPFFTQAGPFLKSDRFLGKLDCFLRKQGRFVRKLDRF